MIAHKMGPKAWSKASVPEVLTNVTSSNLKLPQKQYLESGRFAVIDQGEGQVGGYSDDASLVHPASLPVIIFGDHTRCIKFVARPFVQGADGVKVLAPASGLDAKYLFWALKALEIPSRGYARHFSLLSALDLPVPPASEQARIVDSLETQLTRLDAAVAALERVQANLKRYRASVLKAAVEGRLVPTEAELARREGRDYEPASVLLQRILAERRRRWEAAELAAMKAKGKTPKDDAWKAKYEEPTGVEASQLPHLPEGWCWASLDQLLTEPLANGKSVPDGDGFPVLRLTAIGNGIVDLSKRKTGAWKDINPLQFAVRKNDFLIVRGNGSIELVGRAGLVVTVCDAVAYPDTLIRARTAEHGLLLPLLSRWWHSRPIRTHIEKCARTTAGIFKVNQQDLAQTPVPLPPRSEQTRILDEIERLDSVAAAALQQIELKAMQCERLRQSILKWAFEGKLVDQDPNDEPASVLLERIRAERAASAAAKSVGARSPRAKKQRVEARRSRRARAEA